MSQKVTLILALSVSCFCTVSSQEEVEMIYDPQRYRLCVDKDFTDACSQIDRDQQVSCRRVATKTDCILDADAAQQVLAIVSAEEALVAAPLVRGSAVVIGEINQATSPYQTVVLVRSSFTGGFSNLTGLRYCHPGYKHDELVTKYVLEELDWKAISLNCSTGTIEEQKFAALSSFFGSSCRPGQWVEDYELDARLKYNYSNLCTLCGTSGCDVNYQSPFSESLNCLTNNGGDLALTSLVEAQKFFNASSNNGQNYQFLCPDGNVSASTTPCVWTRQLPRLIVTSSDSAVIMQTYLNTRMPWFVQNNFSMNSSPSDFEVYLSTVLEISRSEKIDLKMSTPLSTYVANYRTIPSNTSSIQCGTTVFWATRNEREQAKCQWLAQAAVSSGLQPVISCVQNANDDILSTMDDVRNGLADIVYVDASYGYVARRKNLSNIAYTETDHRQLSKIMLVVSSNTTFTNFGDFKGKSICLPEYGGKEWLAWIDFLRRSEILDSSSCDYGKMFSDFVGQSCAPGAISSGYDIPETDSNKLCAQCIAVNNTLPAKYCNADSDNKYYGSEGALRCLLDGSAEYAVVSTSEIRHLRLRADGVSWSDFQVVNRNGTLSRFPELRVDEDSPLAIITAGEVLIGSNSSKYNDTMLLLRNIEKQFGQNLEKPFKVFFEFNRTRDLLFPDSTPGLFFGPARTEKYIENYRQLITYSENCYASSFANSMCSLAFSQILLMVIFTQVFRQYF